MPIQFAVCGDVPPLRERLRNISEGGLCFCAHVELEPGYPLQMLLQLGGERYETAGIVTRCLRVGEAYEVGVRLLDADERLRVRMLDQLRAIEGYRHAVERNEGRCLSSEEAAAEWIEIYTAEFPSMS